MTLDPDVIKDLLPLYLADEASPATRALVEAHLAADPELARLARAAGGDIALPAGTPRREPSAEKAALDATRRRLRLRSWLLAFAIFTSLMPFTIYFDGEAIRFFLLRDAPATAAISLGVALVAWLGCWRVSRGLRVTGL